MFFSYDSSHQNSLNVSVPVQQLLCHILEPILAHQATWPCKSITCPVQFFFFSRHLVKTPITELVKLNTMGFILCFSSITVSQSTTMFVHQWVTTPMQGAASPFGSNWGLFAQWHNSRLRGSGIETASPTSRVTVALSLGKTCKVISCHSHT